MSRRSFKPLDLAGRTIRTAVAVFVGVAIGAGGYALADGGGGRVIHGCVNPRTHVLTVWHVCRHGNTNLLFNQRGEQGPAGVAPWRIDYGVVNGQAAAGTTPAGCDAYLSHGLGGTTGADCTRLGVGEYELTASGCSKDQNTATAPPITIEVTPESDVNDPNYVLHAQLYGGDEHILNTDGTLTFTIQLFGGEDNTNLQPVDGSADVAVFC
jgi:hypothetical protein